MLNYKKSILMATALLCLSLPADAQRVTLNARNVTVKQAMGSLRKQTGYTFVFSSSDIDTRRKVTIDADNATIDHVVRQILKGQKGVTYKVDGKNIIITKAPASHGGGQKQATRTTQARKLTGHITDEKGEPMIGVTVMADGTKAGAVTDLDGNFTLNGVPGNVDALTVSYIGYQTRQVAITSGHLEIAMRPDDEQLDEVVVVGYGVQKKRDLTGAIASVKSDEITKMPTSNVMDAISGRVSGLDITRASGSAGSEVNITLRGNRSINGSNKPLFIIDGVEGNYEDLNPGDIESVEVLKDASSTAIYGSAGANGVIIITTKRGKEGKTSINFDAYVGMNGFASFPDVLSGDSYIKLRREAYRTAGLWSSPADDESIFTTEEWKHIQNGDWVNWFDEATRTGIQQSYTVSMNGGNENTRSYLSLNYYNEDGILENDDYTRYTLNVNVDKTINNWLKGGLKVQGAYVDRNMRDNQIWTRILCISPLGIPYDEQGNVVEYPLADKQEVSPLVDTQDDVYVNNYKSLNINPTAYLELTPIKGLSIKSVFGAYLAFSRTGLYQGAFSAKGHGEGKSSAQITDTHTYNYKWENIVNYNFSIADKHNFALTGVTSWNKRQYESNYGKGTDIDWDKYAFYNLGVTNTNGRDLSSSYKGSQMMSYVLRLNYSFLGRYLFTVSNRWDGSSMLAPGHQWDSFPAVAAAWRISDEKFMQDIKWLSNLKLRVGYGVTGNAGASEYATQSMGFAGSNLAFQDTPAPYFIPAQTIANKQLGWEKSYGTNVGIDFGVLKNRISMTFDWYYIDTKDILFSRTLPRSLGGFKGNNYKIWQNICSTNNRGFEIAINSVNFDRKNFRWTTDFTFSTNHEEITDFTSATPVVNGDYYLMKGQPINTYYDYQYLGIWQESEADEAAKYGFKPGYIKVKDKDGNYAYTSSDYEVLGSSNPDWTAGLVNSFQIYDFDFSFQLQMRWGQTMKADILGWYCPSGVYNSPSVCDYWTPENPGGRFPRPDKDHERVSSYNGSNSLLYVDGSYMKVKNITLGYTIPTKILKHVGMSRGRIYATVSNPFIFTKSKYLRDYDPEQGGADTFPLTKQIVFGINVTF